MLILPIYPCRLIKLRDFRHGILAWNLALLKLGATTVFSISNRHVGSTVTVKSRVLHQKNAKKSEVKLFLVVKPSKLSSLIIQSKNMHQIFLFHPFIFLGGGA